MPGICFITDCFAGWDDIGYNFLIGEDGQAYEGRSWDRTGAHTRGWNDVAIAFSVMGNFMEKLPNEATLDAVKGMIELGIILGKITPDYKLYGHRDVGNTSCPGDKLYELIQTWTHFGPSPLVKPTPIPYTPTPTTVRIPAPTERTTKPTTTLGGPISYGPHTAIPVGS